MRNLLHMLLACLTLACPFVCGADEVGDGARREHAGKADAPLHRPDDGGDNCVCRGAVQSGDVRVDAARAETPAPRGLLAPPFEAARFVLCSAFRGSPSGLAGRGDSLVVRAFLQNFRF